MIHGDDFVSKRNEKYPLPDPGLVGSNCAFRKVQRFFTGAVLEKAP